MTNFYLLLVFLSGAYLFVQLCAWVFFGKILFPNAGELFERKKSRLEWQTVFPKNMLRLIVFTFVGSLVGLLADAAGLPGWVTLPIGAVGGLTFNFLLSTVLSPLYFRLRKEGAPNPDKLEGLSAFVTEDITADEYGTIRVPQGRRNYYFAAAAANGRTLLTGTRVIVIYCEDSLCFVESEEHFCDILFEEEETE